MQRRRHRARWSPSRLGRRVTAGLGVVLVAAFAGWLTVVCNTPAG